MKCIYCKMDLPQPAPGQSAILFCPFCGKSQKEETPKTPVAVIRDIEKQFGEAALRDKNRLLSFFSDLAPELSREKNLLKCFVECEGNTRLLDVRKHSAADQTVAVEQTVQLMQDRFFIDRNAAQTICTAYLHALCPAEPPVAKVVVKPAAPVEPPVAKVVTMPAAPAEPPVAKVVATPAAPVEPPVAKVVEKTAVPAKPAVAKVVTMPAAPEEPPVAKVVTKPAAPVEPPVAKVVEKPAVPAKPAVQKAAHKPTETKKAPSKPKAIAVTSSQKFWAVLSYINIFLGFYAVLRAKKEKSEYLLMQSLMGTNLCALTVVAGGIANVIGPAIPIVGLALIGAGFYFIFLRFKGIGMALREDDPRACYFWKFCENEYSRHRATF